MEPGRALTLPDSKFYTKEYNKTLIYNNTLLFEKHDIHEIPRTIFF